MKPRRRLFYKYVVPIIGIVVLALAASGGIGIYYSYKETRSALLALQREKAAGAAVCIEQFVREIERQIGWTALPQIQEGANPLELRRFDYVKLGRQVPAIIPVFVDLLAARQKYVQGYRHHPRGAIFNFASVWLADGAPKRT